MRIIGKLLITIIFFIVFLGLFGVINTHRQNQGFHTAGPLGSIVTIAMVIGIIMIWMYKPSEKKKDETDDNHKLDKN